jgi:MFS family permease
MERSGPPRALFLLTLVGLLSSFSFSVVHPVLPLYVESMGVSYEKVGLLFSAYSFAWVVLQVYTGYLADRLGRKRVALLGLTIYAAFAILSYLAKSFVQLLISRVAQGLGLGLLGPALLGLAAGFEEKGKSLAFYRVGHGAGGILGPMTGGFLGSYGLRDPFLLSALAAGLCGAAVLGMGEARPATTRAHFFGAVSALLCSRAFLLICAGGFLAELGYASFNLAVPLAGKELGFTPARIGVVLSSYSLSFTLLQVPVAMCAEKTGRQRLLVGASFLSALFFLGLYAARTFFLMVVLMALLGVTLGAIFVQSAALVAEVVAEERRAMCLAFFDSVIDLSFIVMPLIVGSVAGYGATLPFLVCVPLLMGAGTLFQLHRQETALRPGGTRAL